LEVKSIQIHDGMLSYRAMINKMLNK